MGVLLQDRPVFDEYALHVSELGVEIGGCTSTMLEG